MKDLKEAEHSVELVKMLNANQTIKVFSVNNIGTAKEGMADLLKAIQSQGKIIDFETQNWKHDYVSEKDFDRLAETIVEATTPAAELQRIVLS